MGSDELSMVFTALADPTRREILRLLEKGPATVSELTEPFSISQPAISKHLKVLERSGLITRQEQGTTRLSVLDAGAMADAARYVEHYKRLWTMSFDRLDDALAEYLAGEDTEGRDNGE
jgi:DNA-binding transcriptional ArsR family regulator